MHSKSIENKCVVWYCSIKNIFNPFETEPELFFFHSRNSKIETKNYAAKCSVECFHFVVVLRFTRTSYKTYTLVHTRARFLYVSFPLFSRSAYVLISFNETPKRAFGIVFPASREHCNLGSHTRPKLAFNRIFDLVSGGYNSWQLCQ